ncbi:MULTISPECIES: four helix bundle protein [Sphingobacterium]|uniref:four helix bundle protein n=1 Tax=Sphingobacterium TaxID=28453 RepID=UPI0013DAC330|nr:MULTISPECIES: four helix bundle protein [unclassified Sphingobacterium]
MLFYQYKELKLWQKAIELVSDIYRITGFLSDKERFGLISQINRAAISISSNIAEGSGRNSNKEFVHFLAIAYASTYEVETQLIISRNLGYLLDGDLKEVIEKIIELQKMNYVF